MGYINTGMGDQFGAPHVFLMALRLMLVDRNPFQPCLKLDSKDEYFERDNEAL